MAVLCIAYSSLLISRTHAAAFLVPFRLRPQAGAWLTARPCEPACTLPPQSFAFGPAPPPAPHAASEGEVDAFGDHALACTRTGLIACRAKIVERARVRVAREAVGPDGQVVCYDATQLCRR